MARLPDDLTGLASLQRDTPGDPRIVVAVVDGPVDVGHPALAGARLSALPGVDLPAAEAGDQTAVHGTHVTSIIFGRSGSDVPGVAPGVSGLVIPVFDRRRPRAQQLEIARAIESAVDAGAHVVNVSAGQYTDSGEADDWLERATDLCAERNVLLVAAAGNDGCDCLHVPAALEAALAVGAIGDDGEALGFSNWGVAYGRNGLLAPGEQILGAVPGGGTSRASGTSAATPIVAGVAALLLSRQLAAGRSPDPLAVRRALLAGARPCTHLDPDVCRRRLGGILDIEGALSAMTIEPETVAPGVTPSCGCDREATAGPRHPGAAAAIPGVPPQLAGILPDLADAGNPGGPARPNLTSSGRPVSETFAGLAPSSVTHGPPTPERPPAAGPRQVEQSAADAPGGLVYALGTLGYDFGTEARRDSFKQLMAPAVHDGQAVPANPHDTRQMVAHLQEQPSEGQALIWTLNLELTPLYALEPVGPFATEVYTALSRLLAGEILAVDDEDWIERVSIPGRLSGRTARLFSGQVVPVVELDTTRGLYGWRSNWLVSSAIDNVRADRSDVDEAAVAGSLQGFLNRVYYDMRNLGVLSGDRALNFAATNVFQAAAVFADVLTTSMQLDTIDVEPSPYARADADAWDVKLKFFDPENLRRARQVFRFTVDVSESMPVTLGQVRSWPTSS